MKKMIPNFLLSRKCFVKTIVSLFFIHLLFCSYAHGQVTIEFNAVLARPIGTFAENINRDGFFGHNFGIYYTLKSHNHISFGLQFNQMPYDESSFSDLRIEDNLFIRQRFNSNVAMQCLNGVIRLNLKKQYKTVNPYFVGVLGVNRFYGITKSGDAFFTGDTNNDDVIDDNDGEINLQELGITTSVTLPKSSNTINHSSLSPTIGLGFGLQIKIVKSLKLDTRITYMQGLKTSYYDFGSQNIETNSIDHFKLVESPTPVFLWTMGFNITI
jgi:hypothetical protein